jgi:N6-L-threonylcarbamoyladenine synthase
MKLKIILLGIESTVHTFGVGIIDNRGKIYINIKKQYIQSDQAIGIKPFDVAQFHYKNAIEVLKDTLKYENLKMKDIY